MAWGSICFAKFRAACPWDAPISRKMTPQEIKLMETEIEDFVLEMKGVLTVEAQFDPEKTKSAATFFGDSNRKILFIHIHNQEHPNTGDGIRRVAALLNDKDIRLEQIAVQFED